MICFEKEKVKFVKDLVSLVNFNSRLVGVISISYYDFRNLACCHNTSAGWGISLFNLTRSFTFK